MGLPLKRYHAKSNVFRTQIIIIILFYCMFYKKLVHQKFITLLPLFHHFHLLSSGSELSEASCKVIQFNHCEPQ